MSRVPPPPSLQKPQGYKDAGIPIHRPPPRNPAGHQLPNAFRPNKRRRSCCRTFCCYICVVMAILLLLLLVLGATFYAWFNPQFPEINPKSIAFTRFNVSSTPQGPTLNSQINILIDLENPNRNLKVEYGRTEVSMNAAGVDANLGGLSRPGFTQDSKNVTTLKLVAAAQNVVLDGGSAKKLNDGLKNKNLDVSVKVNTGVGIKGRGWSTTMVPVEVVCEGMNLDQLLAGGSDPKCRIQILYWFYVN